MTVRCFDTMIISILISVKETGRFKIPNREVTVDWARWVIRDIKGYENILDACVDGPVSTFEEGWPSFMQQQLDPKLVAKEQGSASEKTAEKIYQTYILGLVHSLQSKSWEVTMEPRAGSGHVDYIRLISRKTHSAVLIGLKFSKKREHIERDAREGLQQIEDENYRNQEGLLNISFLREYGIASFHLDSCVRGRYLELDARRQWEVKEDPVSRPS
jgi:hypothetical protein